MTAAGPRATIGIIMEPLGVWPVVFAALLGVAGLVALVVAVVRRPTGGRAVAASVTATLWIATLAPMLLPDGGSPWSGAMMSFAIPATLAIYPDAGSAGTLGWVIAGAGVVLGAIFFAGGDAIAAEPWWILVCLAVTGLALVRAIFRYRRRLDTAERSAVRWAVLGSLITVQGMLVLVLAGSLAGGNGIWGLGAVGDLLATIVLLVFPAAATAGLLVGARGGADGALRAVLAVSATLWVTAGVAGSAAVLSRAASWTSGAVVGATALVAAVVAVPTYLYAARVADRLVYGGRPDPLQAGAATLEAVAGAARLDDVLERVAAVAASATGSRHVSIEAFGTSVGGRDVDRREATPERFPLSSHGEELGAVFITPRPAETALTSRDRAVGHAVAAAASPAIRAAHEAQEVAVARARLLVAREEERRTLRRDLHDDLAPTLVGLGLTASGIARMLRAGEGSDSASADAAGVANIADVADALVVDLHAAIAQTRDLAHGLRPPVLDDAGLVAAIRDRTATTAIGGALVVFVHATPDPIVLPAAVEVSALRIVQEAVANARRHADASHCDVSIEADAEMLRLDIQDDGCGIPARVVPGLGLASMRERAIELGGMLEVSSRPGGGTRVFASIPLGASIAPPQEFQLSSDRGVT